MLDYIVTISISAFTAANYMGYLIPVLKLWPYNSIAAVFLVVGLVLLNFFGIKSASRFNIVLVIVDIVTELSLAILGVILLVSLPRLITNIHWGVAPTLNQLLFGISISMVAYTGIETVSNLGAETRKPGKNIPKAVLLVFFTVLVLYALLSMTALSAYPLYQDANGQWVTDLTQKYLQDPILGITRAMPTSIFNLF
jgi:APA family basic amino acid/polyamine antiporter